MIALRHFPAHKVFKVGHPRVSFEVPKLLELQVPVKKKVVKKTNEKLGRLIDRSKPSPSSG